MRSIVVIAAVLLVGTGARAQTPADQAKKYMAGFIGRPVSEFAFAHGAPNAQFALSGGRMMFQWEEHRTRQGVGVGAQVGSMTIYKPAPTFTVGCRVSITGAANSFRSDPTLADWTIVSWRADGNGCA